MQRHLALQLVVAIALVSCATYRPTIDTKGVDVSRYEQDLSECQAYANQENPAMQAATGAAIGAALGAIIAAAAGARYDQGASARVGAVSGGATGVGHGIESQMDIIRNCLRGRGYSVLN